MRIDLLQWINWIIAGVITAIFVLVGYFFQKKYEQLKEQVEKKRAAEEERRNRIRAQNDGDEYEERQQKFHIFSRSDDIRFP